MKKSSAWCMLVPGLVILFLFLMIPLLRVLVPSVFTGDYPFSAYVDFFKERILQKDLFENREDRGHHDVCLYGGRNPDGVFHQPL